MSVKINGMTFNDNSGSSEWEVVYSDPINAIFYEFMANANASLFIEKSNLDLIGTKNFNGVKWDVYYLGGSTANGTDGATPGFMATGYLCVATRNNITYMIIISGKNDDNANVKSIDSELFKNNINPLLESVEFKEVANVPQFFEFLNMTQEEYDAFVRYSDYI